VLSECEKVAFLLRSGAEKEAIMEEKTDFGLLSGIKYPSDLRKLKIEQLPQVCDELRRDIIEEVSVNPGHFASSLGVVELTVALHYVFNTPDDRIVWDVGHQAYGHKILTGRRDVFFTNRKLGGVRPFPTPDESEYDAFVCGHASNSISAALGMAFAAKATGHKKRHVVAVIGDGAMSGGLAFEGLNNVSSTPNDLLIILNDNDMSIDRAVGGMEKYLLNLDTNATYNKIRYKASRWLNKNGYLNDDRRKGLIRLNNAIKSAISHQQNIFEGMNIRYFGPFDGHDVTEVVRVLRQIKDMKGPKLLHLHTVKGKGYKPAEQSATVWHAPGKFDAATGERIVNDCTNEPPKFQDVFGETLLELARQNEKIVGVTPAMPTGCSMNIMMKEIPERTFDVGIAEGHAVTFSAGMAKDGLQPFCNIYSSFAQRAYDNIIHDVAILKLPVVICLDRAGLVGEDGPTHHGAFDLAYLRPIPNLTIASPRNEHELRRLMYTAQLPDKGPFVIRYPRGRGVLKDWKCALEEIKIGTGVCLREGKDIAVISIGPVAENVSKAIEGLKPTPNPSPREGSSSMECSGSVGENAVTSNKSSSSSLPNEELPSLGEGLGVGLNSQPKVAHYDLRFLKPLDETLLDEIGRKFKRIITVEDGVRNGGMGTAVMEWMNDNGYHPVISRLGLPDQFVQHGTVAELQKIAGIDAESIAREIVRMMDETK